MLGFVLAQFPSNTISNLELWRSHNASRSKQVLLSASTVGNICWSEFSLKVDTITKQLPSWNEVGLALDCWTSTNKLATKSVIACYKDQNCAFWEVPLACEGVDSHFVSYFESWLSIIHQGSTYWSKASHTFGGSSWSFWAYQWLFTWEYDWQCCSKWLDDSGTTINLWGLRTALACNAKPHTMPGAHHSAGSGCIYEQYRYKRPHQVLGGPSAWSAIWREWKHSHRDESKTGKRGNARINKVSAIRPGLAKIIEKLRISSHFGRPETDHHIAENACCVEYADTWLSKRDSRLSKCQSTNHSTTNHGFENMVVYDTRVAGASLPITRFQLRVAQKSKIQWLAATFHNTGWMDDHQVRHGCFGAISILDAVDVEKAHCYLASHHKWLQWDVQSYGKCYASWRKEDDSIRGTLILRREVCMTEAFQILCWSNSYDWDASQISTYPWSFPEVAIIQEVWQCNGYQSWGSDFLYNAIRGGNSGECG